MKIDIRDPEAVRAIRPVDGALYLRASGWEQKDVQPGKASIWARKVGDEEFEAMLPMDIELRDYALRMGDLLEVLTITEKRSQWQVYSDLLTITADVIRIRIADPELTDGTLPIEENAQIAQKARELMLAAACAVTERRPYWHKRKPTQAMDHVRRIRIGQSERGSYVVTIINRITPLLHATQEKLFETDDPYERKVTQTLAQSLHALDRAAEQAAITQEMAAFDNAVPQGVNANLCDAVVGLWGGDEVQRSLEFSFSWSPTRPVVHDTVRRVSFTSDRIPVIREAGRQMREREPLLEFELQGPVVKLERPEGAPSGKVTIVGLLEDRQIRVALELEDKQYHVAVQAHDQGQTVRTTGVLTREGRGYTLSNPSDLAVETE
jgi:hypothetical protein